MTHLTRRDWAVLALIFLYSSVPSLGGLIRVLELMGGPAIAPPNLRAISEPLPIVLHVLGSSTFCLLGALQFLPRLHGATLHRRLGRVVLPAGLLSAGTGLWMTHAFAFPEALQGTLLYLVRMVLGLAMIGLLVQALCAIKRGQVTAHRAAMLRAYAIGQGASTQALFGLTWILIVGSDPLGPTRDAVMIAAWFTNLTLAEWLIRRRPARLRPHMA